VIYAFRLEPQTITPEKPELRENRTATGSARPSVIIGGLAINRFNRLVDRRADAALYQAKSAGRNQ
jgi:GGDEF domain-containing protein